LSARRTARVVSEHGARHVPPRFAGVEQRRLGGERVVADFAQRAVVVEHPEAPAERRTDQVVLAPLDGQVAERDRRRIAG